MPDSLEIQPLTKTLDAAIRPPGSKSITNRALVCAALAVGASRLRGALDSDDTRVMIDGLRALGVTSTWEADQQALHVVGSAGCFRGGQQILVGNSGTTMRFLTAAAALADGQTVLDGVARMRERPVGDLIDGLRQLGATVECDGVDRCPPVRVAGGGLPGGVATVRGDVSSQYLSGMLLAAPMAQQRVEIRVDGPLVSIPYVEMTLQVMRAFNAVAKHAEDYRRIEVDPAHRYRGVDYAIEPDASAASYFFAAAAVVGGRVRVEGLHQRSLQGDVAFCDCLARMGCHVEYGSDAIEVRGGSRLQAIDIDMNAISDTVQTLAVVALFAEGSTRIRNVAHIRHKETDRIAAVACELRKLGADVEEFDDGLAIHPGALRAGEIDTYDDHRMAMSFAVAGLKIPGVVIHDPRCTAKTYPDFFADLNQLCES